MKNVFDVKEAVDFSGEFDEVFTSRVWDDLAVVGCDEVRSVADGVDPSLTEVVLKMLSVVTRSLIEVVNVLPVVTSSLI